TLDTPGIHRLPSRRLTPNTQEFLMSIASSKAQTVRGYLIVKDSKGLLKTVYSESIYYIENGSFENGDLSGWTSFQTWKDESGLSAFRSERVVHSGNYGSTNSNPYDAVGNYLFGLYVHPYDNGNKDLNQERMGSLRSSNFVIAGSGVISFKLGGGKNPGTAYVSVRDASNDVEIERYANRHFFNNSIASQQFGGTIVNSEGFLFQYFANLSAHLGKEVYLVFEDAASHEWNVLAIDHVITYYPVLPVVSLDQTAVNILPVIANKGVATNSIPNGTLSSNLNQWENPQGVYQISNGGAISSVGGNGALGVLRSPAFHVNGVNKYLQFDFAGAISKDKQVFVLVKEVGTNQEVLRLVRRNDQANRTDSGDFRTHWYDLSVLSTEKEYYLEVVDNRNGDWGVALIRNVSLTSTPLQEYQLAVNAFYGIAQVSTSTGDHRQLQLRPQESNHDQSFWVVSNLGEEASDSVWINYHSLDAATRIEYTRASDVFFHQSSFIVPNSKEFFSSISSSGGITYGFTNRKIYSAQITNLDPNQQYIYRIHNGAFASQVYSFQTAPVQETFQFVYFTDTQSLQQTHVSIIDGLLSRVKSDFPEVAFGMISGDLVERGSASMHWDYFFEARANRFSLMSVPGNHDYFTHIEQLQSAQYYNLLFANPQNGRSEFLNSSYFIKYSNTLFIFLDVVKGEYTSEQIAWLQQVVNQHRQDFVIVSMHYSAYGTTHTSTATTIKTTWAPIFENLDIDLVFSGHDHVYARTPQMKNGVESIDVNEGTIYLIGGSGSHKLYSVPQNNTTFEFYLVPTVSTASVVTISSEAILVQTINKSGVILDSFSIPKKNITP
ncbi:MAG: metallophosphoesterase family protein, partial [Candidatus Izemoplasmatales bacterium]|nr:metallophosphoesterase family protein [Candidatus Izemoplasmatales bacterium]